MKIGNSSLLISNSTMFRKSYLFSAVRSPNPHSQTSPQTHTHTHYNANTLCGKQNHIQTATHKNSARTHTEYIYTHTHTHMQTHEHTHTHTHAHLFEDPTNLSNSALGMLLMGDRGRGWWKCLRPGRIDRLAAPNERQACLRNHEGRAVGLQQRS